MYDRGKTDHQTDGSTESKATHTEVLPNKQKRRRFTVAYKLRILEQAEACTDPGQVGALLRRERLYSSHLANWRKLRREGRLMDTSAKKRGPKPLPPEVKQEMELLRKQNQQLRQRLVKAETIIDIQKKVSILLEMTETTGNPRENS